MGGAVVKLFHVMLTYLYLIALFERARLSSHTTRFKAEELKCYVKNTLQDVINSVYVSGTISFLLLCSRPAHCLISCSLFMLSETSNRETLLLPTSLQFWHGFWKPVWVKRIDRIYFAYLNIKNNNIRILWLVKLVKKPVKKSLDPTTVWLLHLLKFHNIT